MRSDYQVTHLNLYITASLPHFWQTTTIIRVFPIGGVIMGFED